MPRGAPEGSIEWSLGDLVLSELEDHVVEMERYLTEDMGGEKVDNEPRWKAARPMVLAQINQTGGSDTMSTEVIREKAQCYHRDLKAEGRQLESQLLTALSALVKEECLRADNGLPRTDNAVLVQTLEREIRPKIHRLVELPLWLCAAESWVSNPGG